MMQMKGGKEKMNEKKELTEVNRANRNNSANRENNAVLVIDDRFSRLKKSAKRITYALYNFADIENIQQKELEWIENCLLVAEELLWRVRKKQQAFGEIVYKEQGRVYHQNSRLPN